MIRSLRTLRWKVLSSITKAWSWGSWTSSIKTKNGVAFLTGSFLITNPLNVDTSSTKRLYTTVDLFSVDRVVVFNINKVYTFTFFKEVLKFWNYNILSFCMFYYCQRRVQTYPYISKLSDIKKSHIPDSRYIFFSCTKTHLSTTSIRPVFWYLKIFFRVCYHWVLRIGYHVNFVNLSVVHNFSNVFPD